MHLPCLITLVVYLIALASASPIAWPDDKLEEINALRARGVSEVSRQNQAFTFRDTCIPPWKRFLAVSVTPREPDCPSIHQSRFQSHTA